MRDEAGHAQLWTVSPSGTELRQVTSYPFDIASAFSWHPERTDITHIADGSVWIVNTATGDCRRVTEPASGESLPRPEACVFSPDGLKIAYVQPVVRGGATWNQIFVVESGES
jgi:Tol biopolymer transport system component